VKVWDVRTEKVKVTRKSPEGVGPDAIDPQKPIGSEEWTSHLTDDAWQSLTGRKEFVCWILTTKNMSSLWGGRRIIGPRRFSPDGGRLVATSGDGRLSHLGPISKGQDSKQDWPHQRNHSILIFADGKRLATGSLDRTIRLWDATTWQEVGAILAHGSEVTSLDWSLDSKHLVSGGRDGAVKIWDVSINRFQSYPRKESRLIMQLVFSGQRAAGFRKNSDLRVKGGIFRRTGTC